MALSFETLTRNWERLSVDDSGFWCFQSREDLEVCLQFHRNRNDRLWSVWFRLSPEASKQTVSRQHLPLVLGAFQVDLHEVSKQLIESLLMQAAWADHFVEEVRDLLGATAVEGAIEQNERFMQELSDAVRGIVGEPLEPSEHQPKDDASEPPNRSASKSESPEKGRNTRLRVVKTENPG